MDVAELNKSDCMLQSSLLKCFGTKYLDGIKAEINFGHGLSSVYVFGYYHLNSFINSQSWI